MYEKYNNSDNIIYEKTKNLSRSPINDNDNLLESVKSMNNDQNSSYQRNLTKNHSYDNVSGLNQSQHE